MGTIVGTALVALQKITSRKFIVFVIATWLLYAGRIPPWVWLTVAVIYIGGNVAQKFLSVAAPRNLGGGPANPIGFRP